MGTCTREGQSFRYLPGWLGVYQIWRVSCALPPDVAHDPNRPRTSLPSCRRQDLTAHGDDEEEGGRGTSTREAEEDVEWEARGGWEAPAATEGGTDRAHCRRSDPRLHRTAPSLRSVTPAFSAPPLDGSASAPPSHAPARRSARPRPPAPRLRCLRHVDAVEDLLRALIKLVMRL